MGDRRLDLGGAAEETPPENQPKPKKKKASGRSLSEGERSTGRMTLRLPVEALIELDLLTRQLSCSRAKVLERGIYALRAAVGPVSDRPPPRRTPENP